MFFFPTTGLHFSSKSKWQHTDRKSCHVFQEICFLWAAEGNERNTSLSLLLLILLHCCLGHSHHSFPVFPPPYPLLSQFTLFPLWEVLNWYSLSPLTPPLSLPLFSSGVLSQFTLILWGTGPSIVNPSSPDFPRPSNNSCKTFDAQQICIGEIDRPFTVTHEPLRLNRFICIGAGIQSLLPNRLWVRLCWAFQFVKSECCEYKLAIYKPLAHLFMCAQWIRTLPYVISKSGTYCEQQGRFKLRQCLRCMLSARMTSSVKSRRSQKLFYVSSQALSS